MNFSLGFKKYFTNTSWLMAERILFLAVTLIVGIYVTRYLGPQRQGILSYASSFVGLFMILSTLGLDQITVRELVKKSADKEAILGTVFWLKLYGSLALLGGISFALYFIDNDTQTKYLILIVAAGSIFKSFNVVDFYFQSQVVSKYVVLTQVFQLIFSSVVKITLVFLKAKLLWFAVVMLADSLILAVGLLYSLHLRENGLVSSWRFDVGLAKRFLKESWPLALSGLVVTVYMKIDQVMINEMLNTEAVGMYAVAVSLSEAWYFFPGVVLKSLFPAIISLKENHGEMYFIKLQQLHDLLSFLAFPIALLMFFFSEHIVVFLFGEQFSGAGVILAVHIWAGMFVFPGNVRAHLIIIHNKQIVALIFRSIGAVINVILNFILIPKFGAIGAAWATLASYIIPICLISFFDSLMRLTMVMTIKSYFLPFRALIYRRSLYRL